VQSYDRLYPPFEHGGAEQSLHGNPWDPFE
jgi:hypothetical protein